MCQSVAQQRPLCAFRPSVRSSFSSPDLILILILLLPPAPAPLPNSSVPSFLSLTHAPSHNVVNALAASLMFNRRHPLFAIVIFSPPSKRP